ncbi:cell wall elongation regulator TseB-like domain-containing protein [Longirhabdus pacifica]|uniref:cell wall elongation regulator TseB-like domain-containing protein n=1 Tax=Longirhabdus pacifica TaxID=2305227 RepID=UPI001008F1E6|nr:DUF5590 domain-containing protein [Longirhabdus pacifica]
MIKLKRKGIVYSIVLAIAIVFILLYMWYRSIMTDRWSLEEQAERLVLQETDVVEISEVTMFTGEQVIAAVFGNNDQAQETVVWVSKDAGIIHQALLKDSINEQQMREQVLQADSDKQIIRVVPGTLREQYVWEVYYSKEEEGNERYYYDFYLFSDGTWLETYRLTTDF